MRLVKRKIIVSLEGIKEVADRQQKICPLSWRYVVVTVWDPVEDNLGLNYSNVWASHQSTWIGCV